MSRGTQIRWAALEPSIVAILCDSPLTIREIVTAVYERTGNDKVSSTNIRNRLEAMTNAGLINKCVGGYYRLEMH